MLLAILLLLEGLEELLVYFVLLPTKHVCELKTLTRGGVGRGLGMVIAGAEGVALLTAAASAVVTKPTVLGWNPASSSEVIHRALDAPCLGRLLGYFFFQLFFHCKYIVGRRSVDL